MAAETERGHVARFEEDIFAGINGETEPPTPIAGTQIYPTIESRLKSKQDGSCLLGDVKHGSVLDIICRSD